jgi:hypothetical protein
MLSNVINSNTFISKKNSIFLKFKNDQLFQKPTTGRANANPVLSPDHVQKQDEKVLTRLAKLNQLFQETSATETKHKSVNFSPLTLSKSPETFHQWVEDNISRKKKKKKQKSYLYAEDP